MGLFAKSYTKCFECGTVISASFSATNKSVSEKLYNRKVHLRINQCPLCRSWNAQQYIQDNVLDACIFNIFEYMDSKNIECDINEIEGCITCISERDFKTLCKYAEYALSTLKKSDPYTLFVEMDEKNTHLKIKVVACNKEDANITEYTRDFLTRWYEMICNAKNNKARISCHMDALPSINATNKLVNISSFIVATDITLKDKLEFACIINEAFIRPKSVEYYVSKTNDYNYKKMNVSYHPKDEHGNYRYRFYYDIVPNRDISNDDIDRFLYHMIDIIKLVGGIPTYIEG